MTDTQQANFTDAEITQQSLANASALPYLMVAFARDSGRTPAEAAAFAGKLFAPGCARLDGMGALALARHLALNMVCAGAEVERLAGDERAAEVIVSGVPIQEEATFFGINCDDADQFCGVFAPIAESLGFSLNWRRAGDKLVLKVRASDQGLAD